MNAGTLLDVSPAPCPPTALHQPTSFVDWRGRVDRERVAPVVAVAGSRGKTSVIRAVESIFAAGGIRYASWTNRGVEIEGESQRGELGPWSRVLTRLSAGGLDIALQELDWATVQAIGTPGTSHPIVAVANLCGNSDACLATPETLTAIQALKRLRHNVTQSGRLILNANDFDLADGETTDPAGRVLIGVSPDAPMLRRHLAGNGDACWIDASTVVMHQAGKTLPVVDIARLTWVRDGNIPFALQNALIAAAIAGSCGIPPEVIADGLTAHVARPESMPGSFNVFDTDSATVVIDRPMASWFLRPALRAAANLGAGRDIRVVGTMLNVARGDLWEVGRLLGRQSGVVVIHGQWTEERMTAFRQGAAANEVPPLILQAPDERSAIQQGMGMLRPGDVLLILAENAPAAVRLVTSRVRRHYGRERETAGAA